MGFSQYQILEPRFLPAHNPHHLDNVFFRPFQPTHAHA